MSTHQSKHKPVKINTTRQQSRFKATCIACFIVARAIPRVLGEIPGHLRDLGNEVRDAWRESANR